MTVWLALSPPESRQLTARQESSLAWVATLNVNESTNSNCQNKTTDRQNPKSLWLSQVTESDWIVQIAEERCLYFEMGCQNQVEWIKGVEEIGKRRKIALTGEKINLIRISEGS